VSVEEHTTQLAGSPVFYRRSAGDGEPVLYLHGIPTSSEDWLSFLERTGGIAPDLPGFGRSGKGGHLDYSLDGYTRFIERLLEALGVERVKLVGHDWGAAPGVQFTHRHPDRVSRLVVCNGLPLQAGFRWPRFVRWLRAPGLGELIMGSVPRRTLDRTLRQGGPWPEERLGQIWEQFDQGTQRAILRAYRAAGEERLSALGDALTELDLPALVLWGQRDPWFGADVGRSYAERLPRAELVPIASGGHWPWLEDETVPDRVAQFLAGP
jgi:pimeloyl-ACP methyl ester carboxylesterase